MKISSEPKSQVIEIIKETYNSTGNGQDANINNGQTSLLPVFEVLTVIHVQPKDSRETDCSVQVSICLMSRKVVSREGGNHTAEPTSK